MASYNVLIKHPFLESLTIHISHDLIGQTERGGWGWTEEAAEGEGGGGSQQRGDCFSARFRTDFRRGLTINLSSLFCFIFALELVFSRFQVHTVSRFQVQDFQLILFVILQYSAILCTNFPLYPFFSLCFLFCCVVFLLLTSLLSISSLLSSFPPLFIALFYLLADCLVSQATLQWGKKDEPVYVTEESGVVGLNFHQSKEVLIQDNANGHYDVSLLFSPHVSMLLMFRLQLFLPIYLWINFCVLLFHSTFSQVT